MWYRAWPIVLLGLTFAGPVAAEDPLPLPIPVGAELRFDRVAPLETLRLPIGPATRDSLPAVSVDGRVTTQSWQIPAEDGGEVPPVLAMLMPIREVLIEQGYRVLLDCADRACGGFDFRRQVQVVPAPDMFLNLRDFRAFAARKEGDAILVLVSRSGVSGFVQISRALAAVDPAIVTTSTTPDQTGKLPVPLPSAEAEMPLADRLLQLGRVVLDGVQFDSGAATLSNGSVAALRDLANLLIDRPDLQITLVGHTDADGTLAANLKISRARAQAVRQYLIDSYSIAPDRIDAEGAGYLLPIAPLTDPARAAQNRRVEAVLMPR